MPQSKTPNIPKHWGPWTGGKPPPARRETTQKPPQPCSNWQTEANKHETCHNQKQRIFQNTGVHGLVANHRPPDAKLPKPAPYIVQKEQMKATGHEARPQPKAENQKKNVLGGGNASKEQKKAAEPEASCRSNKSVPQVRQREQQQSQLRRSKREKQTNQEWLPGQSGWEILKPFAMFETRGCQ